MSKQPKRRISNDEFSRRIVELESVYGQKQLANKLGVSTATVRRYRQGNLPRNQDIYKKINQTYSRKRSEIEPEKVERRKKTIERAKEGRIHKPQYLVIEDYINYSPFARYVNRGIVNIDDILALGEKGYVFSYIGNKNHIPLEGQFVIHGEVPGERNGVVVKIAGIMTHGYEDKDEDAHIFITMTKHILSLGLTPTKLRRMTLDQKHDLFREVFFETEFKAGTPGAYLGFYFLEGDEI